MARNSLEKFPIKKSWVLAILLIIPAVAAFGAWDMYLNDEQLKPYLRFDSLYFPLYLLVFELPHVIASFFGFFQKEYVAHYKKHLFFGLPLVLLLFLVLIGVNFYLAIVAYLIMTLFHVIRQQTGIALFFGVPKNNWHWWWTWFLIAGLASVYLLLQPNFIPLKHQDALLLLVQVMLVLATVAGVRLIWQTKSSLGLVYILATLLMAFVSYWLMVMGYAFLSVLAVRVVHDVTAFLFYITHEMNSNQRTINNVLYRYIPFLPWSLIVLVPLAAVLLGLTVRTIIEETVLLLGIVMTVSIAHYYLESIIWKRENLHREHINITD